MKKLSFIVLLLIVISCNTPETNSGQAKQSQTNLQGLKPAQAIGTQISPNSLKPPIRKQAGTPQIIQIPTKPGTSYFKHFEGGDKKIDLLPPVFKLLPVVVTNLQRKDLTGFQNPSGLKPDQSYAGRGFFTTFTTDQGLSLDAIACSKMDKTGNLWFGTSGGGVSRYDGKSFTNFTTAQGLANNTVWSITEDKTGNLWFGTFGGGVSRYDGKFFTNFTTAHGLANNTVLSITEDKAGNLWFGTSGGGVSRYDGSRANHPCNKNTCKHDLRIQQALKEHNNELAKSFTNFTTSQGLANNTVLSITEDKTGNFWFGTSGGGVSRYDGNRVEAIEAALQRGEIIPERTQQDLKRENGKLVKSFTNFTTAQGLANNTVLSITEDKTGNLWFGTDGGASRYDGKSFTNFTTAQGLPDNTVSQVVMMKEDPSNKFGAGIAIGTNLGVGVAVSFTPKKLKGNPALHNIPVQNDMNNQELENYDLVIEIYNSSTGYPIKDVNSGQNCMMLDSKGIIWAGTGSDKTGLVRFDYDALIKNTEPPKVVIQNVKLNNENICWFKERSKNQEPRSTTNDVDSMTMLLAQFNAFGKTVSQAILDSQQTKFSGVQFDGITKFYPLPENLVLPYEHNNISFEFNAIETGKPYLVNYQYILEGYDKEWSPLTKKTSAAFGNIYEGNYTFKLKAQSPEGVWSAPVIYTFKVLPPWFRTWWMYSFDAIVIFILLFGIYRWRTAALRRDKEILETTVEKRTLELAEKTIVAEANEKEALGQKHLVEEKQKEILDSIHYASRIQQALLTGEEYIKEHLVDKNGRDYFILYKPKDIVAGDFYWAYSAPPTFGDAGRGLFYIATADCTGHGVPGAFMSMLNISFLNENVIARGIKMPDEILNTQRSKVIKALNPKGNENSKDGMDCVLCAYDFENMQVHFAAANNQISIVRRTPPDLPEGEEKVELLEFKGDKTSVGKHDRDTEPFTLHTVEIKKGDIVYTFTDGYPDQFGSSANKKLQSKTLKKMLLKISNQPMQDQKEYLHKFIDEWKGNMDQTDDILVVGVRI